MDGHSNGLAAGQLDVTGTYLLTATSATRPAHIPEGARNSAFTAALLELLRDGADDSGSMIRIGDLYPWLLGTCAAVVAVTPAARLRHDRRPGAGPQPGLGEWYGPRPRTDGLTGYSSNSPSLTPAGSRPLPSVKSSVPPWRFLRVTHRHDVRQVLGESTQSHITAAAAALVPVGTGQASIALLEDLSDEAVGRGLVQREPIELGPGLMVSLDLARLLKVERTSEILAVDSRRFGRRSADGGEVQDRERARARRNMGPADKGSTRTLRSVVSTR